MKKEEQKLMRDLLNNKIELFSKVDEKSIPPSGWIKAIRISNGMTLKQLAGKLDVSMQSINQLEQREKDGAITLNKLKEVATALDMNLVYGFLPKEGKLESTSKKNIMNETKKTLIQKSDDVEFEEEGDQDESFFKLFSGMKRRKKNKWKNMA